MANTKGEMDTYMEAYRTYVSAQDWDNAEIQIRLALSILGSLPDTEQFRWDRRSIQADADWVATKRAESSTYAPRTVLLRRDTSGT